MEPNSLFPIDAFILAHSHSCSFCNIQSFCPSKIIPVKDVTLNVVVQGLKFITISTILVNVPSSGPLDS